MRTLACGAATLAALLAVAPTAALATAEVSGSPQEVSIKAQNSSIEEILSALSREFHIQYHSTASLEKHLTGTYQGSLQRVLMRILEGHNFIVKASNGQIDVTVFGTQSAPGTAVAAAPPGGSKGAPAAAPTIDAQSPSPSTKTVEQPPTSSSNKASDPTEIKVAEGTMTKLMPTPSQSSAATPMPTSAATGSGPELSPAKGQMPMPGTAAGAGTAGAPLSAPTAPQAAGPTLGPASGAPSMTPTPAPGASGPTLGTASAGGSLSPTPAPATAGPTPPSSH